MYTTYLIKYKQLGIYIISILNAYSNFVQGEADGTAAYKPILNEIHIFANLINGPDFHISSELPRPAYYGGLVSILGRELSRMFEIENQFIDGDGRANEWLWENSTCSEFRKKMKILEEQYNAFHVTYNGSKIQPPSKYWGALSTGENMATNIGVKLAYEAFKQKLGKTCNEKIMKNFTNSQLFWIGYAQSECLAGGRYENSRNLKDLIAKQIVQVEYFLHSPA